MSDGVHNLLDPANLDISPKSLNLLGATWDEATMLNPNIVEDAKDAFKVQMFKEIIEDLKVEPDKRVEPNPKTITKRLTDYCLDIVNTGLGGKPDHATVISFRAGGFGERAAKGNISESHSFKTISTKHKRSQAFVFKNKQTSGNHYFNSLMAIIIIIIELFVNETTEEDTAGYIFYEMDSELNIVFNEAGKIKGATLGKLVERATYEKYPGNTHTNPYNVVGILSLD